jgi:hypothetical protein
MREGPEHAMPVRRVEASGVERTAGQAKLARLLAQQNELAKDTTPVGEAKYQDLMMAIQEQQAIVQAGG